MTRKALLFMIVSAVFAGGLNGCEWKNTKYDAYVKDGRVVSCPPEIDGKSVQFPTLTCHDTTIEYHHGSIDNMDSCLDTTNKCKPDAGCALCDTYLLDYLACQNFRSNGYFSSDKDNLPAKQLSFIGSDQNNNSIGAYSEAAQHQICPKDYPICGFRKNNDGKGEFGCVEDNFSQCACTEEDVPNSKSRGCDAQSNCIAKECNDDYHLKGGGCVADSLYACGAGETDCTVLQGWGNGNCVNGVCVASGCKDNFHLVVDGDNTGVCEVDSIVDCGSKGHACETKEGVKQVACIEGECVDFLCDENYHKSQDDMRCKKDTYSECGSWNFNCGNNIGWVQDARNGDIVGSCIERKCVAEKCAAGYHVFDNSCEQDNNDFCGEKRDTCINNTNCSGGVCVSTCPGNETSCLDGCFDTQTNPFHCGDCNTECNSYEGVITSCSGGSCHYQCPDGMGNCNNDLNDGCETNLLKYKLKDNGDGTCSCAEQRVKCGTTTTDTQDKVPYCIDNLEQYGLVDAGDKCACASPYTACGETKTKSNDVIPLCLQEGHYYKNYSRDSGDQFREQKNHSGRMVYYNYKSEYCQLALSFWESYYNYYSKNQEKWHGKDPWNSETCAILCNSGEQIDRGNSYTGISNDNVYKTFAHRCKPKSACHQFDAFNKENNYYYDYGCKDGDENGYYKEKSCYE